MSSFSKNSFPRRKGNFPKKSDRELESFLPAEMKAPTYSVKHGRGSKIRKSQNNSRENSYNSFGYETDFISEDASLRRQDKENKAHSNSSAENNRFSLASAVDRTYGKKSSFAVSSSSTSAATAPMKVMKPLTKISKETFQTSAVDYNTSQTMSPRSMSKPMIVLNRNTHSEVLQKPEPGKKFQILKPSAPVILSRNSANSAVKSSQSNIPRSNHVQPVTVHTSLRIPGTFKTPTLHPKLNPIVPAEMSATLRLLKKDFTLDENCNSIRKYLVDVDKFVVVGVIGRQGVGKSAVAALLAQSNLNMDPNVMSDIVSKTFKRSGKENTMQGNENTGGLDVFITKERVIVLDFPSLFSPTNMDSSPAAPKGSTKSPPREVTSHTRSMQFLSLALQVCHSVVLVQDSLQQCQSIISALKNSAVLHHFLVPTVPVLNAQFSNQCSSPLLLPTLMVVSNKVQRASSAPPKRRLVQQMQSLSDVAASIQFFSLPFVGKDSLGEREVEEVRNSRNALREAVMGTQRRFFKDYVGRYSERAWFEYVVYKWEQICKSSLYWDYSRLFP